MLSQVMGYAWRMPSATGVLLGIAVSLSDWLPCWRCRESDQRCFTPRPSGGPLDMDPLVLPITGLVLVVAQIIYGDTPQSRAKHLI